MYGHKNTDLAEWNTIESLEINPHLYSLLIFDRGSKHIQWAKDSLFNKWCANWTDTCRKMKADHLLISHTRINSKWITYLNLRPQTMKIIEENIGNKILDIVHVNILSDISPQIRETKEKINKWDFIRLKSFCTVKDIISKIKTPHQMGEHNH